MTEPSEYPREAIYLIGPPGVGKTTLMNEILDGWRREEPVKLNGTLVGEPLTDTNGVTRALHLGKTREQFGGTDALSMAVNPKAIEWVRTAALPQMIFGEGQRLANMGFLAALHARTILTVVYLTAPERILDARCDQRGSKQDPRWRKAGRTRAANLAGELRALGVHVAMRDTSMGPLAERSLEWQVLVAHLRYVETRTDEFKAARTTAAPSGREESSDGHAQGGSTGRPEESPATDTAGD